MASVKRAKEFALQTSNKVGTLASLLRALADAGINVIALSGKGKGRKAKIRLIASDTVKTGRVLKKAGLEAEKANVLLVDLADKPGAGAQIAEGLAEAGINLESACAAAAAGGKALMVIRVEDSAAAAKVIRKL